MSQHYSNIGVILSLRTACTDVFVEWAYQWWRQCDLSNVRSRRDVRVLALQITIAYGLVFKRSPTPEEWARDFMFMTKRVHVIGEGSAKQIQAHLRQREDGSGYRHTDLLFDWWLQYRLAHDRHAVAVQRFATKVGMLFLGSFSDVPEQILVAGVDWTRPEHIVKALVDAQLVPDPRETWRVWFKRLWNDFVDACV